MAAATASSGLGGREQGTSVPCRSSLVPLAAWPSMSARCPRTGPPAGGGAPAAAAAAPAAGGAAAAAPKEEEKVEEEEEEVGWGAGWVGWAGCSRGIPGRFLECVLGGGEG